ncbi:GT2D2 protein, partial [Amia calva]|nr:GT2D2 protein [Amia calva]
MSKTKKVDKEGKVFQERWEWEYLFVEKSLKPVCLICKEFSRDERSQYRETKHKEKYCNAAVKANYIVSQEIAKTSRSFYEGSLTNVTIPSAGFAAKLNLLCKEVECHFSDFNKQQLSFQPFSNPFGADNSAPEDIQTELIELQCNDTLKVEFNSIGASEF